MAKKKFKVTARIVTEKTYTVSADNWRDAVEKIGDHLDEAGITTLNGFAVADEFGKPIDTLAKEA